MRLKVSVLMLILVLAVSLIAGCGAQKEPDVSTSASIATDEASFLKAAGKDGTWIVCTLADLEISKEIVLEGEFTNREKIDRKIALYTQDDDHNVTGRFTLTAPKLTVKSENTRLQGGTFKGDIYVEAKGFKVVDATVEGNVYFANEEIEETFALENGGNVTGVTEVKND